MSIYTEKYSPQKLKDRNTSFFKILKLINSDDRSIVDIGCSSGYFDQAIKNKDDHLIWGVEINKQDALQAQPIVDKIITKNLETSNWSPIFKTQKFDVAIMADVLEHLNDPWIFISKLKSILSPNGFILASIPNICHYSFKIGILNNSWQYQDFGLMDRTHLHFFSYPEIINLFEKNGFYISKVDYTISNTPNIALLNLIKQTGLEITEGVINNFFTLESHIFQYVIKASIKKPDRYLSYNSPKRLNKLVSIPKKFQLSLKDLTQIDPDSPASKSFTLQKENTLLKERVKNLQTILDNITSAKTFKLWQSYNLTKRNLFKFIHQYPK